MKSNRFISRSFIAAVVLLTACNNNASFVPSADEKSKDGFVSSGAATMDVVAGLTTSVNKNISTESKEEESAPADETSTVLKASIPAEKIPEKIKKTADINLTVDDYKAARSAIGLIIKSGNAYVGGENEEHSTYSISNKMVIRVANKDFDKLVNSISGIPARINSKNIYTEDVTAQFVDLSARLKSKKEVEKRYQDLLQKAVKVGEILEVEEQLRLIREEIEAKEGELNYLNDVVDYSTINLSFEQNFEYTPAERPGFFGRVGAAFGNGWNGFLNFIIGLVYSWPVMILVGIGIFIVVRFVRRRRKK